MSVQLSKGEPYWNCRNYAHNRQSLQPLLRHIFSGSIGEQVRRGDLLSSDELN